MRKSKSDNIFISFSKVYTQEVAKIIHNVLANIYSDKKGVNIFISSISIQAGKFENQIQKNINVTKVAVSVLSPENKKNAPWLMYEAGALALASENNGGAMIPYLFCRHRSDVESPLQSLQNYQYQKDIDANKSQFIELFLQINKLLSKESQLLNFDIETKIMSLWNHAIAAKLSELADKMYSDVSSHELLIDNQNNLNVNTQVFETVNQADTYMIDDFSAKTPRELEKHFEKVLDLYIPSDWKKQDATDKKYNATRVIVNDTLRLSTFVCFTDGEQVLLLDRPNAGKTVNVINNRFDVFGSVQFENRTIAKKIDSPKFLDAEILKIAPIYGAALEDNRLRFANDTETAIMFGITVYLKPEDLIMAKKSANKALIIIPINKAKALPSYQLTSKAHLAIKQL